MRRFGAVPAVATLLLASAATLLSACAGGGAGQSPSVQPYPVSVEATDLPPGVQADDIAFVRGNHVWRAHADGSNPVQLTEGSDTNYSPIWSPNRKEIAYLRTYDFTLNATSSLCFVSSSGGRVRAWSFPTSLQSACYSPDGKSMALADMRFSGPDSPDDWTAERILLFDMRTHATTVLYELRDKFAVGMSVSWSPDGTQMLVGENRQDLEGQRTGVLTVATKKFSWLNVPNAAESHWAPDGQSIVVSQEAQGSSAIAVVKPNGRIEHVLAKGAGEGTATRVSHASYSPDGTRIVYQQGSDIFMVRPNGTDKVKVIPNGSSPAWSTR